MSAFGAAAGMYFLGLVRRQSPPPARDVLVIICVLTHTCALMWKTAYLDKVAEFNNKWIAESWFLFSSWEEAYSVVPN